VLCGDFRGAGRGSWRGASEGAQCLRGLPTGSPLYARWVRVATRVPAIVPGSLFLFSSLWGLWTLRRRCVLERVYGHGVGALVFVARRCLWVADRVWLLVSIGLGVPDDAPRRLPAFGSGPQTPAGQEPRKCAEQRPRDLIIN
jgi:hypothetical protein